MIYLFLISINFIFLISFSKIEKNINLFDYPNEKKIHLKKISLLGGIIFLLNISVYFLYVIFFKSKLFINIFGFSSNISNIIFLISTLLLFFVGLVDDKKNLSAKVRILFLMDEKKIQNKLSKIDQLIILNKNREIVKIEDIKEIEIIPSLKK